MSPLASLVRAYERLEKRGEVPSFGFSTEKIGFLIPLAEDGSVVGAPIDLRGGTGKKREPRMMRVPAPVKRTSGVASNTFWDKTSYALGVTAGEGKHLAQQHADFRDRHLELFAEATDPGLLALRRFLETWTPEAFVTAEWPEQTKEEMKDENIVFALASEMRGPNLEVFCIHDRPAARALWARLNGGEGTEAACLVTGEHGPIARLHPVLKNVWNSQSAGARLVSFNLDASESYEHKQGDNAPISEYAAFAYVTALDAMLVKGCRHRVQIGDASTAFWADATDAVAVEIAVGWFADFVAGASDDDKVATAKLGAVLEKIRTGVPIANLVLDLPKGVRFYVLGLAPNAARVSVRFYFEDDFQHVAENLLTHHRDLQIEPPVPVRQLAAWHLAEETAIHVPRVQGGKTIWRKAQGSDPPPNLSGEIMRAILSGGRYPLSLLDAVCRRVRAEQGRVTPRRAAICRAVINRNDRLDGVRESLPMALDREEKNAAYRLGRLFALLERSQLVALGKVNATIRDRYFGGACTAPAKVFPMLVKNGMHHLSSAAKDPAKKRLAHWLEKEMGSVWSELEMDMPKSLRLQEQGRFQVGYFHQRFAKSDKSGAENLVASDQTTLDGETASKETNE